MNPFKMPKIPDYPVIINGERREVKKDEFMQALNPIDVGLTRGGGPLGWFVSG